ncbi:MAG: amino acid ABC transporter permease [Clostridia bacterium]|nr:amino acid ABC transporter permease [Clostridia bacterium]MBR2496139.1 amino acid ABC transporter permease [Clostridia bacterium]MBR6692697.1 amino acid ABC transporter permease [Clostridia bacterium]
MDKFINITSTLLGGFTSTVLLFLLTLILALPLGLLISFCTMSKFKPLKYVSKVLVWILRGTPLMLQIFVIFYVPGLLFGFIWPSMNTGVEWIDTTISTRFIAALVAFVINYAAYFSEIFRGGIEGISKGQYEAGAVLGLTKTQVFFKIVLLQVVKRIIPPMSNEIITLIKDTSLANVIAVEELMFKAQLQLNMGLIWPIFYAGLFYLIASGVLTLLLGALEKKLSYFN